MRESACSLGMPCKLHRRAHLVRDRARHLINPAAIDRDDVLEQGDTLLATRLGERCKGSARCCDSSVDILRGPEQDLTDGLFGRRIDHVELASSARCRPCAVDEKASEVVHENYLLGCPRSMASLGRDCRR